MTKSYSLTSMLLAATAVSACAAAGGDWPSLRTRAERHIEVPAVASETPAPSAQPPNDGMPNPNSGQNLDAKVQPLVSRIEQENRAVIFIEERWHKQRTVLIAALTGFKKKGPGDVNWSKAQTELTRLNQIAAELDDALIVVNGMAGQLAVLLAEGVLVAKPLVSAGRLIKTIETLQKEAAAANMSARRKL